MQDLDFLVVGSGPAGMSAAITGASEGMRVGMIDGAPILGGKARESSAIENYPGFPKGITGSDLMGLFAEQASKFGTVIHAPVTATDLHRDGDYLVVTDDVGHEFVSRAVLLALGLTYRRLSTENVSRFLGTDVFYGMPESALVGRRKQRCTYIVIGGANSAGQAVLRLCRDPRNNVVMLIRRTIHDSMSHYLIERIRQMPNVEVREGVEAVAFLGNAKVTSVLLSDGSEIECTKAFAFIGAIPRTQWVRGVIDLSDRGFVPAHDYQTSEAGVFVAGDVRDGSIKRVATSIGEGAAAAQAIYRYVTS